MFVWIPRYAYKITSGCNTSVVGTIEIKFLEGATNKYGGEDGHAPTTYPTVTDNAMDDFVLHPAFKDGTSNNFANGEWDNEIPGFWVAKFQAGYQASTIDTNGILVNEADVVEYSNLKYTSNKGYTINALGQTLANTGYLSQRISYPVFKPQTYVYNVISIGDSYSLSREIASATAFYGLDSRITDSHMIKNSEYGALLYLTQSSYGRNGVKPNINNLNFNSKNSKNIYAVTGFVGAGISTRATRNISLINAYNTTIGGLGSSTGNIYGVYDLNGCLWEKSSAYITNRNASLKTYGQGLSYNTSSDSFIKKSTKYSTTYPYYSLGDSSSNNWKHFKTNYIGVNYGDALLEVSSGSGTWYSAVFYYPNGAGAFFHRGSGFNSSSSSSPYSIFYAQR